MQNFKIIELLILDIIYGHGSPLGHVIRTIYIKLVGLPIEVTHEIGL